MWLGPYTKEIQADTRRAGARRSQFGFFHAAEDFGEVFVGVRGFVAWVFSAVAENIVGVEFGIDFRLVEGAEGIFSSECPTCAVVDGVI